MDPAWASVRRRLVIMLPMPVAGGDDQQGGNIDEIHAEGKAGDREHDDRLQEIDGEKGKGLADDDGDAGDGGGADAPQSAAVAFFEY